MEDAVTKLSERLFHVVVTRLLMWIDVVEEDMKKRGVVQQDAGDREGWRRRAVKGLANPR